MTTAKDAPSGNSRSRKRNITGSEGDLMWEEKRRLLCGTLFFLLALLMLNGASSSIGIDDTNRFYYRMWNNDTQYFIDRGGFVISNTMPEIQARMEWCVSGRVGITFFEKCFDDAAFSWAQDTDNLTFAHLTAYRTYQGIDINLLYALDSPDVNRILIRPQLTNKNLFNVQDLNIIFKHIDINLSMDLQNDRIQFYKNGLKDYSLEGLQGEADELDVNRFRLYDSQQGSSIFLWWDSFGSVNDVNYPIRYLLRASPEVGQIFSSVSLIERIGTFYTNDTIKTNFWWKDPPNNPIDANVVKIDGFADNLALKVFNYFRDGNLTIDFNVFDLDYNGINFGTGRLDANIDYRNSTTRVSTRIITDLNLTRSLTIGSNKGKFCDDLNFAGGKDKNRYGVTCRWDWNILNVSDSNYFIDINTTDNAGSTDINSSDYNFRIANSIDVNIVKIDGFSDNLGLPVFSYVNDGNLTIDFNVFDHDFNGIFFGKYRIDVNINYFSIATQKSTRIITDLNITRSKSIGSNTGLYCDDLNFAGIKDNNTTGTTCRWDWDILSIPDGNYFIDINATDNDKSSKINRSDQNFRILGNKPIDVNIVRPNGGEIIGVRDGNYRIDFNVSDKDCNGIFYCSGRIDANIELRYSAGTSKERRLVTDINLMATSIVGSNKGIYCDDLNFAGSKDANKQVTCHYDWNLSTAFNSGDYRVDVNVTDNNRSTDQNRSVADFRVYNWLISSSATATGLNMARKITRSSDGNVYVTFLGDNPNNVNDAIWFAQSDNNGLFWKTPVLLMTSKAISRWSSIDINSSGGINLIFVSGSPGAFDVFYTSCSRNCGDGNSNWSLPIDISQSPTTANDPVIDINSTDGLHVFYDDGTIPDIMYRSCSKNCQNLANWSTTLNISNSISDSYNPTVDLNSSDGIHVAWRDIIKETTNEIEYRSCSKNCGVIGSWDANINLSKNTGQSLEPSIINTPDNKVHIVWYDNTSISTYSIRYRNCASNCGADASWGNDFNVSFDKSENPIIVADSDSNIYVLWNDYNVGTGLYNINTRKRKVDSTWDANVAKTNDTKKNYWVNAIKSTTVGTSDYWDYVWTKGTVADYNIVFKSEILRVPVSAPPPSFNQTDVNIVKLDGNLDNGGLPIFIYSLDGNITIDFNISDKDYNGNFLGSGRFDANIDWRDVNGESSRIITDLNLMQVNGSGNASYCDDLNFAGSEMNQAVTCRWDWNFNLVPDTNVWIDINVTDNNNSSDQDTSDRNFGIIQTPSGIVSNNIIDANTVKFDGNPDNLALPSFYYGTDGNLTIDFNVFELDWNGIFYGKGRLDANINARDTNGTSMRIITDLNLVRTATAGSNTGLYCDDLNFAGGKDVNRYGVTCHWDWNIALVTDRNVFIDLNVTDNNGSTDINSSDYNFRVITVTQPPSNNAVDVNIVKPNGGEIIGVRDGNYRIDFNVSDKDCNGIFWCNGRLDANIDYNVGGGWKRIVTDLNLLATATAGSNKGIYCDDLNFAGSKDANKQVTCHYDWNLAVWREPSVDSKIDVNVTDNNGSTDTNRSGNKFRLHNWLVSSASDATAYGNSRKLVRNSDGNKIYLVYYGYPPNSLVEEIWFTQSDNNGSTWETPVTLSNNSGISYNPSIDINSTGGVHVFWYDNSSGNYEILYKSCSTDCNVSSNWSSSLNITNNATLSEIPVIDINSTDGIILLWGDSPGGDTEIMYKACSDDCGNINNWSANVNLSNDGTSSYGATVDINSTNGINVAWYDTSVNADVLYKSCSFNCDAYSSWSSVVNISSNLGVSENVVIVAASDGNLHLAWRDLTAYNPSYNILHKSCANNCITSGSWSAATDVSGAKGKFATQGYVSDGNLIILWMDYTVSTTLDNINSRIKKGTGVWDSNIIKTDDSKDNQYPNARKNTVAGTSDYLDYIYTQGVVPDYNIVFIKEVVKTPSIIPPTNNLPDANIVRVDGNRTNAAMAPKFDYYIDGNLTIDYNVFDSDVNGNFWTNGRLDANLDYRKVDTNVSTRIITDLNLMGTYCNDTNFAGGDINKFGVTCHWDWNVISLTNADGNYTIDINITDLNITSVKYGDFNFLIENRISNNLADVNVEKIDGYADNSVMPVFNYYTDGNLTIDFNISDLDINGINRLDANINFRDTNGLSTRIITDLNLMVAGRCDDINFTNSTKCSWDWNIMLITDRNVFIDVNITDNNGSIDTNTSDFNFGIRNFRPLNKPPDANITKVDGNLTSGAMAQQFDYYVDGNFTIDFNVHDLDWNGNYLGHGRLDVNIDYRKTDANISSRIITDLNITNPLYCDDLNFAGGDINKTGAACHWDWNAIAVADGNYALDMNISDGNSTAIKYGDFNFYVKSVVPAPPVVQVNYILRTGLGMAGGTKLISLQMGGRNYKMIVRPPSGADLSWVLLVVVVAGIIFMEGRGYEDESEEAEEDEDEEYYEDEFKKDTTTIG